MQNNTITKTREALFKDIDALKNDATKLVADVKDHANAHVNQKKQLVNDTITQVRQQATAHPFALLGIGFVLGVFFSRRMRA